MPFTTDNSAGQLIKSYQRVAPVDVISIAEHLGINVWQQDSLGPAISGLIRPDALNGGKGGYSIIVRKGDSEERKRFTIAHEIAHFILHKDHLKSGITDDTLYRSGLSTHEEVEANKMAADILMPYSLIQSFVSQGFKTVEELASKLGVSETAMSIRLNLPT